VAGGAVAYYRVVPTLPTAWPLTAGLAAAVAWAVARAVCSWAEHRRILDVPNERSSHSRPTPRLGGLGLIGGVAAGVLVPIGATAIDPARYVLVLAIAVGLAAVSLLDDLRGLSARLRLVVHAIAGAATIWGLDVVARVQAAGLDAAAAWAFAVVAAVWIVAFVNAFNFMDGIDGIAAGQALVAGLGWLAVGATLNDPVVVRLAAAIAGAAAGFLILNWSPARLFMGDVGSAFFGYLLAAMPLVHGSAVELAPAAPVLVWPFLFDTAFTLLRRASRGEPLLEAHRSHLYQRLTSRGQAGALSHAQVAAAYMALAAAGVPTAWALATGRWTSGAAGVLLAAVLAFTLWRIVAAREAAG
jgi:UDP-N-acetylmuramyl pentapeptide phosphotransferase/UDP-N-acetylglucosamine-1-phosphate transferase